MDPNAYLQRHGWTPGSGLGSAAHAITRPILVAHKYDNLGLGKKKHNHADAWWERAFDSSLKTLDVTSNKKGGVSVTQTEKNGALNLIVQEGLKGKGISPLYNYFVKGTGLQGSLQEQVPEIEVEESKKRKRGEEGVNGRHSKSRLEKEERRAERQRKRDRKEARKLKREEKGKESSSKRHKRDKSSTEDSEKGLLKPRRKEEKMEKQEPKEERRSEKAAKRAKKDGKSSESKSGSSPIPSDSGIEVTPEAESAVEDAPVATLVEGKCYEESKEDLKEKRRQEKANKDVAVVILLEPKTPKEKSSKRKKDRKSK